MTDPYVSEILDRWEISVLPASDRLVGDSRDGETPYHVGNWGVGSGDSYSLSTSGVAVPCGAAGGVASGGLVSMFWSGANEYHQDYRCNSWGDLYWDRICGVPQGQDRCGDSTGAGPQGCDSCGNGYSSYYLTAAAYWQGGWWQAYWD
jgi:hypothetical protein